MVETEEDPAPAGRARHAPPQERPQPQQLRRQNHHQVSTSSTRRVAPQSRLHNFSFPSMSWGKQRLLRCVKVESRGVLATNSRGGSTSPSPLPDRGSAGGECGVMERDRKAAEVEEEVEEEEDERLDKFRDAMMAEFQKAFDRIPVPSPPPRSTGVQKEEREKSPAAAVAEGARPWNLRLRRAACNAPAVAPSAENVRMRSSPSAPEKNLSTPSKNSAAPAKYSLRSDAGQPKDERPKFSRVLSREEVEEDFFVMTGSKPPRRPKKRPRNVQKQLEGIFPGFYLTEVTPDLYKITEDK